MVDTTAKIEIEKLVPGGEGLARLPGGKVLFVPLSLPGERLEVCILEEKKDYAVGEITGILEHSPHRVEPPCSHFGVCGGCQLQHCTYEHEIELKLGFLHEALRRGAKLEMEAEAFYPSPEEWGYRSKSEHPLSPPRNTPNLPPKTLRGVFTRSVETPKPTSVGSPPRPSQNPPSSPEPKIGYYQRRSHDVVNVSECPVIHPASLQDLHALGRVLAASGEPIYDERTGKGNLRHVILRRSGQGKRLVGLVTREKNLEAATIRGLMEGMDGLAGLVQNVNPQPGNRILGGQTEIISGVGHLAEEISGLRLRVSFPSFFQANLAQAQRIAALVQEFVQPQSSDVVCDAFAGVGMIGLSLSSSVKQLIAVENHLSSVEDGRHNAQVNSLENVTWKSCDAGEALENIQCDILILDPPRKGLAPRVISSIIRNKPRRVAYVSCNPATWARDVGIINEGGYRLKRLAGLDMFPRTAHVELVSLLEAS